MYIFCDSKKTGLTVVELAMVIFIFSFFLIGIYVVLDGGLKAWNMGQTRTDLQNTGIIVLRRMVRELSTASNSSLIVDPNGEYVIMETPIKDADFTYNNEKTGYPWWQGYITYYIYSPDPGNIPYTLYRKYELHEDGGVLTPRNVPIPKRIVNPYTEFKMPPVPSVPNHKPVASNLDNFSVARDGHILNITMKYRKKAKGEDRTGFSVAGTADKGSETFEIQASVVPKN